MRHFFVLAIMVSIVAGGQIPSAMSAERNAPPAAEPQAALFAQLQPSAPTTPSIGGTPKLPIAAPHANETDRDMIIKILDSLPGIVEQLKLIRVDTAQVRNDTAQIQLKLDTLAAQVRRPVGWSLQIPPNERWELLLNGQVVVDHETGLMWERAASQQPVAYAFAVDTCRQKKVLLERVTDLMVEIEGQGNPDFRRNVWVKIEEGEPASWSLGGMIPTPDMIAGTFGALDAGGRRVAKVKA